MEKVEMFSSFENVVSDVLSYVKNNEKGERLYVPTPRTSYHNELCLPLHPLYPMAEYALYSMYNFSWFFFRIQQVWGKLTHSYNAYSTYIQFAVCVLVVCNQYIDGIHRWQPLTQSMPGLPPRFSSLTFQKISNFSFH